MCYTTSNLLVRRGVLKMAAFDFELVGKIGSMALIRKDDNDIDYNIFSRLCAQLRPGFIWVSSGATEIGRLDYMKRNGGKEIQSDTDDYKNDYAAQGQSILMENYRRFISPQYSVRQILVEHQHFNNPAKREYMHRMLTRAAAQNAIPIINYNDAVSDQENLNYELKNLRLLNEHVVECVDNDETAAVVACLVKARTLLILTTGLGIYHDPDNPSTLIREITGATTEEVLQNIEYTKTFCKGASRAGANGAKAKLSYISAPVQQGTQVIIGSAEYRISDLLNGTAPRTWIGVRR